MSWLVELQDISKMYRTDATEIAALKNIYFQIAQGEMIAIVGASGSGKSTLMNILGFLDRGTSGKYLFSKIDVSNLKDDELACIRNKKIGFVFQSFFLIPRFDAVQNVMLPLFYRGIESHHAKQAAIEMLEKVGMKPFRHHKPNQLSGGQLQRVAIARALVGNPDIILADEPTGALDSHTAQDVLDLLKQLNQYENRTIIIVTHDHQVSRQCGRIVRLQDGSIVE